MTLHLWNYYRTIVIEILQCHVRRISKGEEEDLQYHHNLYGITVLYNRKVFVESPQIHDRTHLFLF